MKEEIFNNQNLEIMRLEKGLPDLFLDSGLAKKRTNRE